MARAATAALFAVALAACRGTSTQEQPAAPDPVRGSRTDVTALAGSAIRATIADLDGDGRRELVFVDGDQLRVVTPAGRVVASRPIDAGIQVLVSADLDGDGRAELYAGWGQSRQHMDAKARIASYRLDGGHLVEETVLSPETSRQDVAAIVPMPDQRSLLVAYFDSKYMVSSAIARRDGGAWQTTRLAQLRMATSYARGDVDGDGKPDIVVGRVYGDEKGSDGDAFVLAPDGARTKIPSTRGLRSIAVADGEVFLGDGWHQAYAAQAHGLLSCARHRADGFTTELIEDTAGQTSIEKIVPAQIGGKTVIVTLGSHTVRAFSRTDGRWHGLTIAGASRDVAVGDLDGNPGDEILIVGDRSEVVSLQGVGL